MGTQIRIQVVVVAGDGSEQLVEIAKLDREDPTAASLGLTLAEGKQVLAGLQAILVTRQVAGYLAQQRACPHCGRNRPLQAAGTSAYLTLFGTVAVPNPRWRACDCQPHDQHTLRPLSVLLPERTSLELRYLETSWAADASYGSATKHLHDAFPLDERYSAVTVRNHTLQAARRAEQRLGPEQVMFIEGCQAQWDRLPIPDGPLAVGLDGGIVRARRGSTNGKQG
jgi:hypothetical protein